MVLTYVQLAAITTVLNEAASINNKISFFEKLILNKPGNTEDKRECSLLVFTYL